MRFAVPWGLKHCHIVEMVYSIGLSKRVTGSSISDCVVYVFSESRSCPKLLAMMSQHLLSLTSLLCTRQQRTYHLADQLYLIPFQYLGQLRSSRLKCVPLPSLETSGSRKIAILDAGIISEYTCLDSDQTVPSFISSREI
jgi:hypothetical protein